MRTEPDPGGRGHMPGSARVPRSGERQGGPSLRALRGSVVRTHNLRPWGNAFLLLEAPQFGVIRDSSSRKLRHHLTDCEAE